MKTQTPTNTKTQILKVLVGSRAHGLHRADSDYDYRGVYVTPTSHLLKIGSGGYKGTHWVEGDKEDDTAYEIGHFLHLATKSNPTILEVFAAPFVEEGITPLGMELRNLFPFVWDSRRVVDAFGGYSLNQRKKFLDDKYEFRSRKWKYACAYIRTLLQGIELLSTDRMTIKVSTHPRDEKGQSWRDKLIEVKQGEWSVGKVVDTAEQLRTGLYDAYEKAQEEGGENHTDMDKINAFLLKVRKEYW